MIKRVFKFIVWAMAAYIAAVAFLIVLYAFVPPVSTLMLMRWVTGERVAGSPRRSRCRRAPPWRTRWPPCTAG